MREEQEIVIIEIGPRLAATIALFAKNAPDVLLQKLTGDLAEGTNALKQVVEANQPKET